MIKKVNVAIIGYGHLGKWHAQKAQQLEEANLYAIVEVNKSRHREISELFPEVIVTENLNEIMGSIDAGVVVTPTSFHAMIVEELVKNNKHVFCEKPLCSTMEQVESLRNIRSESLPRVFQVGHSERFHQVWEDVRDYIEQGENAVLQLNRISPFKGRATDVDVVQDLMIHDIDLLLYLTNSKVLSSKSFGVKSLSQYWDHVSSSFEMEKNNQALVNVSRNSCSEARSLRMTDSRGELFVDLMHYKYEKRDHKGQVVATSEYPKRDHLLEEHKAFYHSILNECESVVTFEDGAHAVQIVDDILSSLESR